MNKRKTIYIGSISLLAICIILWMMILHTRKDVLKVVFFDVGQGDSVLIMQGNQQVLIDGGKNGTLLLEKIGKYVPFWDRNIELVIETHPDQDHVGGLVELLRAYNIKAVIKTDMPSESQTFEKLEERIASERADVIEARSGQKIIFFGGLVVEILFPFEDGGAFKKGETNSASIVTRLDFGKNSFLFTGDLPSDKEKELVAKNINLGAGILKIGHHGSKYSSGEEFLDAVSPIEAVISVGAKNVYGHPNEEVLQRLRQRNINILKTNEVGDVVYECESAGKLCVRK